MKRTFLLLLAAFSLSAALPAWAEKHTKNYPHAFFGVQGGGQAVLNGYNDLRAMQINGAAAYESANRGVDSALYDYYRTAEVTRNAANIDFGGTMSRHTEDTMQGYKYLEEISKNTEGVRDLADMLRALMEVK